MADEKNIFNTTFESPMNRSMVYRNCLLPAVLLLQVSFIAAQSSKGWSVEFPNIGTHSSPRAIDLNQDGVKDLIIGCSKKEFQELDSGILAINGATGKILWKVNARRSNIWFSKFFRYKP